MMTNSQDRKLKSLLKKPALDISRSLEKSRFQTKTSFMGSVCVKYLGFVVVQPRVLQRNQVRQNKTNNVSFNGPNLQSNQQNMKRSQTVNSRMCHVTGCHFELQLSELSPMNVGALPFPPTTQRLQLTPPPKLFFRKCIIVVQKTCNTPRFLFRTSTNSLKATNVPLRQPSMR